MLRLIQIKLYFISYFKIFIFYIGWGTFNIILFIYVRINNTILILKNSEILVKIILLNKKLYHKNSIEMLLKLLLKIINNFYLYIRGAIKK